MQKILDAWKKLTSGSINRNIFGAAVTVALLTALVKVAAVVKELVVAWNFGTGDELDAFLIALLVPSFIISVIADSFNAALIPTYIQVQEQKGKGAAQRLFAGTIVWSLGLLSIAAILMVVTAPLYLSVIATGFSQEKLNLTFQLLYALAPVIILSGIVTIWSAVLNAGERFALAALCPIITPGISVIFLLLFKSWGIFSLVAGLVCGIVLEIIILGAALKRQDVSVRPGWYGFDAHLRQVAGQYAPTVAGAVLICSAGLVDQSMAAMLSPGSVAALSYGNRLIASPISLMSIALSTAVIPYFAKMAACGDWVGLRSTFMHYLRLIFMITLPLTGLFIVFSQPLVQIFFQRGAFTAKDTQLVAQIQVFSALQIPFYTANIFVVRLITSMRLNYILMWVSAFNLLINIILNYVFMQWLGVKGIALSTSCVYVFSFLYLLIFANKSLKKIAT